MRDIDFEYYKDILAEMLCKTKNEEEIIAFSLALKAISFLENSYKKSYKIIEEI